MKIYTRTGDNGETALLGGRRVPKDAMRVEAYGTVDELNAALGVVLAACSMPEIRAVLEPVQHRLFDLGAELAAPGGDAPRRVTPEDAAGLEHAIDLAEAGLTPLTRFILPGGTPLAAALHSARTVCRRAERQCVHLSHTEPVGPAAIVYLNRLSDLLFVLARLANHRAGAPDVEWKPADR